MTEQERLTKLLVAVTEFREAVGALVSGLVADGFTDEQARDIVAGYLRIIGREEDK